ncbi:AAA family ATPase [Streptomyces sp. HNM0575]|uniref:AAA family ATPase n=1 Tax=Streptomyces sp. HNM0575 TaxID=2716338 RepID=UPI00145D8F43|nr:LuxR family transcriptional regulator [Streptomyces sp. HNM0575]NLU76616.1 AAA family ATPase [Streptomyces sp. HNM0575]
MSDTGTTGTPAWDHASPHPRGSARPELPLLEREREQDALSGVLDRLARGGPSLVTVEGRPGEGQSALLRSAVRCADRLGMRVLHAQATPAEQELRYGAVLQLLTPLSGLLEDSLRSMAEEYRPGTLPGLVEVLRSAPGTSTLLVVEDVQWLDAASTEWLQALVRRLYADVPVALVVSRCFGAGGWSWLGPPSLSAVHVSSLVMRPLGPRSVAAAVRRVCGTDGDSGFNTGVEDVTKGNPAVLHEALWRFRERGHPPVAERLPEFRALSDDVVGERAVRALDGLPAEARAVLQALAVCEDVLDFPLARTLAGPRELPESELLAMLGSVGLIEIDGDTARIRYPAARHRVLEQIPAEERAELHVRAAALAHRIAAPDDDIAAMLFRATAIGAPWVVETLHRSCTEALARDDLDHASACLTRILLEPLEPAERARFSLELAGAEIVHTPEVADRRLGNLARHDSGRAAGTVVQAIDLGLARGDEDWAVQTVAETLPSVADAAQHDLIALYWLAHRDRQDEAELLLPVVPALADRPERPLQAGVRAWQLASRAEDLEATRSLARECLEKAGAGSAVMPRLAACQALFAADDIEEAHSWIDGLIREVRRGHARVAAARLLTLRAEINLRGGRLDAAERDVHAAQQALPLHSWHPALAPALAAVSMCVAMEAGQYDLARELAGAELPEGAESGPAWCRLLFARGQVASLDGHWAEGLRLARESGRGLLSRRWLNPALVPWRSLAARCLDELGRHEEAEELALEETGLARAWGTGGAVALAAVTAGPLTGDAALARLREAARILDGSPERLLHAWSLVQLAGAELKSGDHPAAAGRAARLTRLATTYPSSRPAEALRSLTEELERPATSAAAVVPQASSALTEAERETAVLAVRGHGNREIADLLSVSRRAVELRLSSVYRKLHINGRKELRATLQTREGRPPDAA